MRKYGLDKGLMQQREGILGGVPSGRRNGAKSFQTGKELSLNGSKVAGK